MENIKNIKTNLKITKKNSSTFNVKAVCREMSSGMSGKEGRAAEMNVPGVET
jgi:hypothetical protein